MHEDSLLSGVLSRHARPGRVEWIGLRPARLAAIISVEAAFAAHAGLEGDHRAAAGKAAGPRALTLIQAEHLPVIAALAGREDAAPALLRRNIVVSGVNLQALRHGPIRIGGALISLTGPCAPCRRMESALGHGGYNAMRGHGGWRAEIIEPGEIRRGHSVQAAP